MHQHDDHAADDPIELAVYFDPQLEADRFRSDLTVWAAELEAAGYDTARVAASHHAAVQSFDYLMALVDPAALAQQATT